MKPVLQALVLAEHVYQDVSGKKVIAGTFNSIRFTTKPVHKDIPQPDGTTKRLIPGGIHSGSPYAYVSLTDVSDNTALSFQFVNLTKNEVLFGKEITVECRNRLATIEFILPLPPLNITEGGVYAFEVVCDGEILGSSRVIAEEMEEES